ncbi:glycosyltransferase [Pedobacter sp.]
MTPKISVVISAHNPRKDFFPKVLRGLERQTLANNDWELIIVDNLSTEKLQNIYKINWHPNHRFIVEENLGLAYARKRGFFEAKGDLLINVDDDIILDENYLKNAWNIYSRFPFLGVFGCQIKPEFEIPPKLKIEYYGNAERKVEEDIWSNNIKEYDSTPFGAGMCLRKEVYKEYLEVLETEDFRLQLGRRGKELLSCEDIDIVFFTCQMGLGKGMFKDLIITHFVPETKMSVGYLIKNNYWNMYSATFQNYYLFGQVPNQPSLKTIILRWLRIISMDGFKRKVEFAKIKGVKDALKKLKEAN